MKNFNRQNFIAYGFLLLESIGFAAIIMAADKDINGINNAFSLKYLTTFAVVTPFFFIPLALLYFLKTSLRIFFFTLIVAGLCVGGMLSLAGGGEFFWDNHFLWFLRRSIIIIGVFAISIAAAVGLGKMFTKSGRIAS